MQKKNTPFGQKGEQRFPSIYVDGQLKTIEELVGIESLTDLSLEDNWKNLELVDINNRGKILCQYNLNDQNHLYLLEPRMK